MMKSSSAPHFHFEVELRVGVQHFSALRFVSGDDAGQFTERESVEQSGAREWSCPTFAVRPIQRHHRRVVELGWALSQLRSLRLRPEVPV